MPESCSRGFDDHVFQLKRSAEMPFHLKRERRTNTERGAIATCNVLNATFDILSSPLIRNSSSRKRKCFLIDTVERSGTDAGRYRSRFRIRRPTMQSLAYAFDPFTEARCGGRKYGTGSG